MNRIFGILIFILTISTSVIAQISPGEGSQLHYRRIGFSIPVKDTVSRYRFEIASGHHFDEDSFRRNIITHAGSKLNKVIMEVPAFGKQYTWRPVYTMKSGKIVKGTFYHFSTLSIPQVDTNLARLNILKPAVKFKDAYVFVDGHEVLYDMKGAPVWFIPAIKGTSIGRSDIRDLKATADGTITYLKRDMACEINYAGDVLWKAPDNGLVSGDSSEHYHHEFTRISGRHYMIMGAESLQWPYRFGAGVDSNMVLNSPDTAGNTKRKDGVKMKIDFATIIEYDSAGNVVWSWKSSEYFMKSDLVNYRSEHRTKVIDVHANAFFFDEEHKCIYVSFKNISRVLKVKYPEGNVINSYGEVYKAGVASQGNGLFCDQHGCKVSKQGYLYLFNNNACNDSTQLPTVLIMKESIKGGDTLKKIWEYQCTIDGVNINPTIKNLKARQKMLEQSNLKPRLGRGTFLRATSGGNVIELPDYSMFVSMNTQYGKVFIVSREKKILWSAVPERYNKNKKEWFITPQQYRASIITRKELDNLIWNATK